jgi:cobalt/nickel transport system permease protein
MLSRGWSGAMPALSEARTTRRQWATGLAPVAVAAALAITGLVST